MKIITCFKVVPDDQEISVTASGCLDLSKAPASISNYDLNAIEAAVALAEALSQGEGQGEGQGEAGAKTNQVIALSVGGSWIDDSKLKKNVLSRGPDSLVLAADDSLNNLDTHATAKALKAAIATLGNYDLVICGEGSADIYARQVGIQLGALLGVPVLNCVSDLQFAPGGENKLLVKRTLESQVQSIELPLPAVLSVTSDLNKPRIAGMKQILAAGKKSVVVLSASQLDYLPEATTEEISTLAPPEAERLHKIIEADSCDEIAVFAKTLAELLR